jgi:ubiquinone/menaquinone biosynthesis C-methylase UbiE
MLKQYLKKLIKKDNGIGTENKKKREAWLEKKLKNIPPDNTILDAGAGELQYKKYCSHLKYVSQDFAQYNGKGNNIGLQTKEWDNSQLDIVSDIINIPLPNNSFDAIMCIEVLEHIPEPAKAIMELSRLLKIGGKLIITAPFCSMTHFAPYHYATGFNKYFYEKILNENGLKPIEIVQSGNYFEFMAQEIIRLPSISNKYSHIKANNFEKLIFQMMLNILNKYYKKDEGSSELLCFGYHVFAEKIK